MPNMAAGCLLVQKVDGTARSSVGATDQNELGVVPGDGRCAAVPAVSACPAASIVARLIWVEASLAEHLRKAASGQNEARSGDLVLQISEKKPDFVW